MNKKQTKYNLAISYSKCPILTHPSEWNQSTIQQLKNTDNKENQQNIFNNNFEIRLRKLQIEHQRNYEVVGYKQIQDINLRAQRKKRMLHHSSTRQQKKTIQSRSSINSNHKFLTKTQVIEYYSPNQMSKRSDNPSNISKLQKKLSKKHKNNISQQFSMSKLKLRMQQYKENWHHQIQRKKKIVFKNKKIEQNKMASSVIQSIEQYRTISQQRQNQQVKQDRIEFVPSMWERMLRKDSLQPSKHKIINIHSNGIRSVGYDKYRKELQWLQDKDQNGFFFKKDQSFMPHCFTPSQY